MNERTPQEPQRGSIRIALASIVAAASSLLLACASTPPPTAQIAVSTAAVATAVSSGAPELAPAEMKTARDKLDRANAAMSAKDYVGALSLAQEAQADAGVAQAKAQSVKARKAAETVREDSRALGEEIDRKKTESIAPRN